jgi:hypothetical protein
MEPNLSQVKNEGVLEFLTTLRRKTAKGAAINSKTSTGCGYCKHAHEKSPKSGQKKGWRNGNEQAAYI